MFFTRSSLGFFLLLGIYSGGLFLFMRGLLYFSSDQASAPVSQIRIPTPSTSAVKRLVLMVVDGLRSDLVFSPRYSSNWPKLRSFMKKLTFTYSNSITQPPTVTMPRIKAITSGRVPRFIDIVRNLDATAIREDNWVTRLNSQGWRLEFYGDDTWLKLFPYLFRSFDGTSSFFVNDFEEVDRNVTRHLNTLFRRPQDWDGVILHYLGLDHIGHVEGPDGYNVALKLAEMDTVVGSILDSLTTSGTTRNEQWLFILTGDHGMSDQGGHGGSSSGEVTTALIILSSTAIDKKGPVTQLSNGARTQQVDLATFIGSVTGAGIPSTSLGIIPSDWLAKFYHDPSTQIMAVIDLLSHFARFSGCTLLTSDGALKQVVTLDPGCSSSLLTEEQVILFNNLMKQLALGLFYLEQNNTSNSTLNALASVKTHMNQAIKLSQQLQSRALSGADKLDNTQMLLGGLIMWSVTLYLCLLIVRELSGKQRLSSNHTHVQLFAFKTAGQPELLSYMSSKLLCTFCTVCLLIQTISLSGSSYAEEEHQFWYFFSVSTLVLCTTLVWLGPLPWSSKRSSILCAFGILLLDRVLLRQMHRTGDKWIHLPDLSDWLYSPEHSFWLWPAQIFAWGVLFAMRWIAIESCNWGAGLPRNKILARFSPLLSLLVLSLSQLYYRWTAVFGSSEQVITSARFVYLVLLMDCLCTYNWTHTNQSLHKLTFQPSEQKRFWSDLLQPVATYPLLVGLLGRPAVTILWIGILIKECLLAHVIRSFWSEDHYEQSRAMKMRLSCCWLLYWIQGWTSFFQQGNSLSLATVDVSAAYVGLRTHQPTIAGILLTLYTYAGPLFWQMAYLTRFSLPGDLERHVTTSLACFRLGFVLLPITFCATVCYVLQSHLFIWTVFTPKLLYLAVFHIAFFPLLAIWGALRT
ncbi:GPI ethanolamine phosphate transferase 2 [Clonorchis sinensis]|uniref:GPI ethanolamine phosphate transferase 2 n=1 Tax=Clonorchis sinensis TaxID=79923 RepID=A0A8T1M4N7_CLOSI|nr:GPI ethanolamine phosphate transferase 2 [Clonorchis sinensis]